MDELAAVHLAQPFRPFVIHLADGRSLLVKHPEFLARSPAGRTAIVFGEDGSFEVVDVMLISSAEVPKKNGWRKGKQR
jgi:hypothetical protein